MNRQDETLDALRDRPMTAVELGRRLGIAASSARCRLKILHKKKLVRVKEYLPHDCGAGKWPVVFCLADGLPDAPRPGPGEKPTKAPEVPEGPETYPAALYDVRRSPLWGQLLR